MRQTLFSLMMAVGILCLQAESAQATVLLGSASIDFVDQGYSRSTVTWTAGAKEVLITSHTHTKIVVNGQLNEYGDCSLPAIGIQRQTSHIESTGTQVEVTKILPTGTCVCFYRVESKPDHVPDGQVELAVSISSCSEGLCIQQ